MDFVNCETFHNLHTSLLQMASATLLHARRVIFNKEWLGRNIKEQVYGQRQKLYCYAGHPSASHTNFPEKNASWILKANKFFVYRSNPFHF